MAELATTRFNAESHLLLEQPLLRLPYEILRKNFKTAQRGIESARDHVLSALRTTANASLSGQDPQQSLAAMDEMIARLHGLKRRLEQLRDEEQTLMRQVRRRVEHMTALFGIPSLADVKYDEWSRLRLNRLLVDYMLRHGFTESARALAREKEIEDLVDLDIFVACHRIKENLMGRSTVEALAWCAEQKKLTKKLTNISTLDFQLRLQQFIELRREKRLFEARRHAQVCLVPHTENHTGMVFVAAGLLAFPPDTRVEPYKTMYSKERWTFLASLFVRTHHELLSIPPYPLLHTALSAGLSALKTPACHSACNRSSSAVSPTVSTVCPICSTELNELARTLPYAHHSKSSMENDPVVLPNGRIYGRERLLQKSGNMRNEPSQIRDPITGESFDESEMCKVFIF